MQDAYINKVPGSSVYQQKGTIIKNDNCSQLITIIKLIHDGQKT